MYCSDMQTFEAKTNGFSGATGTNAGSTGRMGS